MFTDRITFSRDLPRNALLALTMNRWLQKGLAFFGRELHPEKWVFIIGCYDSGTTVLASLLRDHPRIGGMPNEGSLLTDMLPVPEFLGWPRMWSECLDRLSIPPAEEAFRARRAKKHWSLWFDRGAPVLAEKSISNMTRLGFLERHFSPAYFIYIIRNGYAVSAGIRKNANMRRWKARFDTYPIEMCARQWVASDEMFERHSPALSRHLSVYYEDFSEKPCETIRRITDFLGEEPLQDNIINKKRSIHEYNSQIVNMNERSIKQLSSSDIDIIEKVAGERLKLHGYERPQSPS
ncbi:MAG: sulfotransferase [Desulfovibrionales bacterium]|nr:sulfotransferase [Desulfovibrionales bacterium]